MPEEKKSYYAIIPANVRYDISLKPNAKLLYGEITALCNERGFCWASNDYFANLYGVKKETISRWISQLNDKKYINVSIDYKEGTCQIINRYIRINQDPIDKIVNTPIDEKVKDNNTLINNTINNTKNRERKTKKFTPPTFLEVEEYINLKNLNVDPKSFYDYFTAGDWIDSKGNKVTNWKQKLITWNSFKGNSIPAKNQNEKSLQDIEKECRGLFR